MQIFGKVEARITQHFLIWNLILQKQHQLSTALSKEIKIKWDQIGSNRIRLVLNCVKLIKLVQTCSKWIKLVQTCSNWINLIKLDQIGSKWSILSCHLSTLSSDLGLNASLSYYHTNAGLKIVNKVCHVTGLPEHI